ncbi:site-specific DNA-methyltransferase [Ruminococcus sp. YE282]|uniref:DNA-methyltransferase n=1 Tax=Ruminococcus sp. YE282 TaxID=3158780 RepID=UPI000880600D|nr:DNA modification methylase [Ruminococcus bromii]
MNKILESPEFVQGYSLIKGDCLEVMKNIPDKTIDMILCDLPYGVTQNKSDIQIPFDKLWDCYERIIKDNGAIVLFAQGVFFVDLVNSNRKMYRYDLIWDKSLVTGFLNAKRMPLRRHEQIAVFYKKSPVYNPQFTKGRPSHSKGSKYRNKPVVNNNYGKFQAIESNQSEDKYPTSIITIQKPHPSKTLHRTEKPVKLLEYLIKTFSNEGDLILDNCMGSGTTGVACINTNRKFVGIEIDDTYFETAKKRIESAINSI